jgi:MATE family multidrug resistance protein
MGSAGAGLAMLLARTSGLLVFGWWVLRAKRFQVDWNLASFFQLRWEMFKKMLGVGFPTMIQIGFEFGFFTCSIIMMGWVGITQLAAQQVVLNYTGFLFMVPLGIAFATTIRVGQAKGLNQLQKLQWIAKGGTCWGALFMLCVGSFTVLARNHIGAFFVQDPIIIQQVSQFLIVVAIMQVFDGVQVVSMASLRGIPDVKIPLYKVL